MKNFIEITDLDNKKILLNVNHIVSIQEMDLSEKKFTQIQLSSSESLYDVEDSNARPTKYIIREEIQKVITSDTYNNIKRLIEEAISM